MRLGGCGPHARSRSLKSEGKCLVEKPRPADSQALSHVTRPVHLGPELWPHPGGSGVPTVPRLLLPPTPAEPRPAPLRELRSVNSGLHTLARSAPLGPRSTCIASPVMTLESEKLNTLSLVTGMSPSENSRTCVFFFKF